VWLLAESIGLSGVLTTVCFAITAARTGPERMPARVRIPAYAVWDTVIFTLNILAFIFIAYSFDRSGEPRPADRGATSPSPAQFCWP